MVLALRPSPGLAWDLARSLPVNDEHREKCRGGQQRGKQTCSGGGNGYSSDFLKPDWPGLA